MYSINIIFKLLSLDLGVSNYYIKYPWAKALGWIFGAINT